MPPDVPRVTPSPEANTHEAAALLEGLETLRDELGGIADDIIALLRRAGVTPPDDPQTG